MRREVRGRGREVERKRRGERGERIEGKVRGSKCVAVEGRGREGTGRKGK